MFIEGLWSTPKVEGEKSAPTGFDYWCDMGHDNSQGLYRNERRENYTNYFRYNMRHAGNFPEF